MMKKSDGAISAIDAISANRKMPMNQNVAPLAAAMKAYAASGAIAFHTPGHKQGLGAHPMLKNLITDEGLSEEVSIMYELDDPFHPTGCIKEAEALAAELYGADGAQFMVNGTTGAIHAMMLAALHDGDAVIVPRNAHRSIFAGLVLTGAVPVYVAPVFDERVGAMMGMTTKSVAEAAGRHGDARAVVAVYPTYYGVTYDLEGIAEIAHAHDMALLVDEAHGAHLKFSRKLPDDALALGADLVAMSTHKLLGSMTQTSMLMRRGERISREDVRRASAIVASTSPNYLLMASLDIARYQMATEGEARVERTVKLSNWARDEINKIKGLWCFGARDIERDGVTGLDVAKLTVQTIGLGYGGAEAEKILRREYGFECELCDAYNVMFIISMADTEEIVTKLVDGLRDFAARFGREPMKRLRASMPPMITMRMTPREAYFAPRERIALDDAVGRVSAEEVAFYPPGIPAIVPGEEITRDVIEYLRTMAARGLHVSGIDDTTLETIKVIKQE